MKNKAKIAVMAFVYTNLCIGASYTDLSGTEFTPHPTCIAINEQTLTLNSHGFNANQKSSFTIAGQTEYIQRGLTVIHFNSPNTYEFKTYDTYSSPEQLNDFLETLKKMQANKASFAILAHDSAVNGVLKPSAELSRMGFSKLGSLKGRQAYAMHNFNGLITEEVNESSAVISTDIPNVSKDDEIYFPRITYEFEPNNNRYIAHAGGEINGVKSTNSKNALDENYKKGFRLFELDIIETSDGKLVAAHDWEMWARFTDFPGALPPSHAEFMKHKIYGDYSTLDLKGINAWFKAHPDATLVTDKVNDPVGFANQFIDKDRLLMELFSPMAVEEASQHGITAMISQEPLMKIKGDKLQWLAINNVKHVALSRRILSAQNKLILQLRDAGIKVYVYNVNFDPGKDEKYVQENEIGLVYGMYADKWMFDSKTTKDGK
ncbi:hypothetical protein D9O36_13180 [Zobellia amurskyensis]|uniref:Glycerophosphoryl diester phosphodiesterase n=1 Tax=Zobellia amurskyensis TaxID=248905 RepID=A0A7X3D2T3_9FLAO|nr:hypothetical protein [Zobellia amurskyensis]MUH36801.1 hypothetical protein [Zobellia amurskyensis]